MKLKYWFCFIIAVACCNCFSQNKIFFSFKKLSRPEKRWVITHPFVAGKAIRATRVALIQADSIRRLFPYDDESGGKVDAFRHCYWMALLTTKMSSGKALKLGKAHEKGNYLEFKKEKLEEGILPDSVSCAMDLYNNKVGVELGKSVCSRQKAVGNEEVAVEQQAVSNKQKEKNRQQLIRQLVLDKIKNGELMIIKKDKKGNYLTCEDEIINMNEWKGKWGIPKCLVKSNCLK